MRIAVIGSGIAGLSAASFLQRRHAVTLYEQDERVGGHTNTVRVPTPGGEQAVDTGWIVYNPRNYPNLTALFGELDVKVRPSEMSFGVSLGDGAYEWKGSDRVRSVFAQLSNLFSPTHIKMLTEILRLNRQCNALLATGDLPDGSLGEFLDRQGYSQWLRSRYLLPMGGMIWSCSPAAAAEYPAADFMRFFDAHGLFTVSDQPQWRTVVGGSDGYVRQLLAAFQGRLKTGTPVTAIQRSAAGVALVTADAVERYDRVVCATHADQALRLLDHANEAERTVLSGIPYTSSRCVLHTDESFLPRRRRAWASWNYLHPTDEVHDQPICGSYWMNLLQHIPGPTNYIVTLNPPREISPDKVLYQTTYTHPWYTARSQVTHARLPEIQGNGGVWWAGAWCGYGFHEDGLKSGLAAVQGIDPDCLPKWATGLPPVRTTARTELAA